MIKKVPGNKSTYLVISLALVAFLGLSVLQILNLQSSIKTNRQIFLQKVDLASKEMTESFIGNRKYSLLLSDAGVRLSCTGGINEPKVDGALREVIEPILEDHNIDTPYEYAVYEHKEEGSGFQFVLGDDGASLDFDLVSCENPRERGHGWANLTCSPSMDYGDYHLALFFPQQEAYVFAQSQGAMFLSIAFILLLIGCFTYTILVIKRQKKLSEIKNDFINNLTHEFKTPIASINLAANLLRRGGNEDEAKHENYINLIDKESKRLEGQVDKILQIAMIDSGNFTLDKKEVDIHEVIETVIESMGVTIEQRKALISKSFEASPSKVLGDNTHLVNVIYNLLDNALKYTIDQPKIEIVTANSTEGIRISIKDNGIGIGQEIQDFIFDKFYRSQSGNVHDAKGFGLGLSYVKKLVQAHQGRISLSSRLNEGSEFQLYFPTT
ncbi:MAG: HAMP domain-containing sensor histidine kinase [Cytophagales bacterium]|nr:HAMP domain-containing sensor histidine kinase [Cytophagales bacterium]